MLQPLNLNDKITKIEPIKNFEKYFMAHQYMPKISHDPHKNSLATLPTYLMYSLLVLAYKKG